LDPAGAVDLLKDALMQLFRTAALAGAPKSDLRAVGQLRLVRAENP
jgi:hypothetical protein